MKGVTVKKRILSIILTATLLVVSLSFLPAAAEEKSITATENWGADTNGDGTPDSNYVEADGDTAAYYTIGSASDLIAFMGTVNAGTDYTGKTVKLTADIVINEGTASADGFTTSGGDEGKTPYNWTACMNTANYFKGTFDGAGFSVSGLYCSDTSTSVGHGLFGKVAGATIKDLILRNSYIKGGRFVSGIAGIVQSGLTSISGCTLDGVYLECSGANANSGGIIGVCNINGGFEISGCTVRNSQMLNNRYWGVIVGQAGSISGTEANKISDCTVDCTVVASGTQDIGGLIGTNQAALKLNGNTVRASLKGSNNVGGLIGSSSGVLISESDTVFANIEATGIQVGAIVGFSNAAITLNNCTAEAGSTVYSSGNTVGGLFGKIADLTVNGLTAVDLTVASGSSSAVIGGIVSQATGNVTINNTFINETVDSKGTAGGLVGNIGTGKNLTVSDTAILGSLNGETLAGGIIGNAGSGSAHTVSLTDVAINAVLTGNVAAGISANQYEGNSVKLTNVVVGGNIMGKSVSVALIAHSTTAVKNIEDTYSNVYKVNKDISDNISNVLNANGGTSSVIGTDTWKTFDFAGWNRMTDDSLPLPATASALAGYKQWITEKCDARSAVETVADVTLRLDASDYKYSGIRFGTLINKDYYDALTASGKSITVGTLIIPTDLLTGELKLTNTADRITNIVNDGWYNDCAGNYVATLDYEYYGLIINLKAANYNREFSAVGYMTVGEDTYYGTVIKGNAEKLAEEYLFCQELYSNTQINTLLKYGNGNYGLASLGEASASYAYGNGARMVSYTGKTEADFESYCAGLVTLGYTLYDSATIDNLRSATYSNGKAMIHVTFSGSTMNVVFSNTGAAALPTEFADATGDYEISVTQLQESDHDNGMGYLIQLSDGSFIIYDGGYADTEGAELSNGKICAENQAKQLYALMSGMVNEGTPIVIRAWVLTHAHPDHTSAFADFAANYASDVTLHQVIISPVNECEAGLSNYLIKGVISDTAKFADAKIAYVYTGMSLTFGGLTMDILLTGGDIYITREVDAIANGNNSSVVSRLYNADNSMLFLADIGSQGAAKLSEYYTNALRCNMIQVSHHGGADVYIGFYTTYCDYTNADILWYDCSEVYFKGGNSDNLGINGGGEYDTRKAMTDGRTEGTGYLLHEKQYTVLWNSGAVSASVYTPASEA